MSPHSRATLPPPTAAPTVAVLAHRGDVAAVALATLLRRRGRVRVCYADDASLAAARYVHRPASGPLGPQVPRSNDQVLLPGASIDAGTAVVLCRLAAVSAANQANQDSQAYADAETFALVLSWLAGLGDALVNAPSPLGLAGARPDLLKLHQLATCAGLRVPAFRLVTSEAAAGRRARQAGVPGDPSGPAARSATLRWHGSLLPVSYALEDDRGYSMSDGARDLPPLAEPAFWIEPVRPMPPALVLDDRVVDAPPGLAQRTLALARAAGLSVAEVRFGEVESQREPVVVELSAVPALGSPAQLEALARFLEQRAHRQAAAEEVA